MGFNNDENKLAGHIIVVFSLFIAVPIGYLIDVYTIYALYVEKINISSWSARQIFGFCIFMFGTPVFHWFGYKYCQENFGWFRKK